VGNRHYVDAAIAGPNGTVRAVRLLIDTGATSLVLPASMISELGFAPADLRASIGWGVGGPVPALIGMLRVVRIGAASADNILVNFVPDESLRGTKLLGMSFLRHFRMTIDDQRNELVLLAK
jgi:aspartyl protease family protein